MTIRKAERLIIHVTHARDGGPGGLDGSCLGGGGESRGWGSRCGGVPRFHSIDMLPKLWLLHLTNSCAIIGLEIVGHLSQVYVCDFDSVFFRCRQCSVFISRRPCESSAAWY